MGPIKLFLCGDVMTGRGIDQILKHPLDPRIFESYVKDARDYIQLAERSGIQIPRKVNSEYIWGDALKEWDQRNVHASIINLETSITTWDYHWPLKEIHYRMNPENIEVLTTAGINTCVLANNHLMDWGKKGLIETIDTLEKAGIKHSGAGKNLTEARAPAIIQLPEGNRILIFSLGLPSSGIPLSWEAKKKEPGVYLVKNLEEEIHSIERLIKKIKRKDDLVVLSIHWGGNWGYSIPSSHIKFAQKIIDTSQVDIIYGHSSHHPIALEIYHKKLILYGCGDFMNDYEGISGMEFYRSDLRLMYFLEIDSKTKELIKLEIVPLKIRGFSLKYASQKDSEWMTTLLNEKSKQFDMIFKLNNRGRIEAERMSA